MTATMPAPVTDEQAAAQSLGSGTVGHAVLQVEKALCTSDWTTARRIIQQTVAGPVDAGTHAGLFYGAPAIAFLLHAATRDGTDRYRAARHTLGLHVRRIVHTRLAEADVRLRQAMPATFTEYDLFYGLTGLGALLLDLAPDSDETGDILRYLVRLTRPRRYDGLEMPGWWVSHHPDPLLPTPGGHANLGMAHGAAGLLALLAHATRRGLQVDGQADAIGRLCTWFDRWQQGPPDRPWWPQWVTREEIRTGRTIQPGPGRPSWCYGSAGIARALHLAALATADRARKATAEHALTACLSHPQLSTLTDPGICHGIAGLYQTAYRAARDTTNMAIAAQLPALAELLTDIPTRTDDQSLLTGRTGIALTLQTIRTGQPARSRWDACLLIT